MIETKPLVSVVMPFHNTPLPFMKEAIESVLNQSYDNLELLLVDDGSDSDSTGIALQYIAVCPQKVRYLEHPGHQNRGASASRQLAINESKGNLIAFLDADDVWLLNKLEDQVSLLKSQPDAGMLYGNTLYWHSWTGKSHDQDRDYTPNLGVKPNTIYYPPTLLPLYLNGGAAVPCTCSLLVRKEVLMDTGGFEVAFRSVYTDQVLYAKLCLATPVYVAETCWDWYRQFPDSSTAKANQSGYMLEARKQFLIWLENYLDQIDCQDQLLKRALQQESWLLETPGWLPQKKFMQPYLRWLKKWILRVGKIK
jgi:glycosyltransferase involved in cell wall biosynthesis